MTKDQKTVTMTGLGCLGFFAVCSLSAAIVVGVAVKVFHWIAG
jgi:hypothetical protein